MLSDNPPVSMESKREQIERNFTYHAPKLDQQERYDEKIMLRAIEYIKPIARNE